MDQAREYVDFVIDNKHSDAESVLQSMLAQRVSEVLDNRKREVADKLYNQG